MMSIPLNHPNEQLLSFLEDHRVAKGSEFTHTSLGIPYGSFYIPYEDSNLFTNLYKLCLKNGTKICLTEKHKSVGPICIDLYLRFPESKACRQYEMSNIYKLVQIYAHELFKFVDVDSCHAYIMEKPAPKKTTTGIKDGIHIIIPDVSTEPIIQFIIRENCLPLMQSILCQEIGSSNSVEDIFDAAVIEKNNWFMYGSTKPDSVPYSVTQVVKVTSKGELNEVPVDSDENLVEILSIRNKCIPSNLKQDKVEEINCYKSKRKPKQKCYCLTTESNENNKNETDNIDEARHLVNMLNKERAHKFEEWIKLGWCLRNIDWRLLDKWTEFSKHSNKFQDGECEKKWSRMRLGGLGIASLHMWAKHDNPQDYFQQIRNSLRDLIVISKSGTHYDIAKVIHKMYKHQFVCASIKNKYWYEFMGNVWQPNDCGCNLRKRISTEVWKEYVNTAVYFQNLSTTSEIQVDSERNMEYAKKLLDIAYKLKTVPFKESLMKECAEIFYEPKFVEKLDSNLHLIGFENGVYDLDNDEFREGRPEDYISFTTGNDYIPYDPDHPHVHGIQQYLRQVLTNPDVRNYVLKLFASFLHGSIKDQKFYIWTGSGSNSKSKLVELFEKSYGTYCCKFPVTLLTQKRAASNAASSELARAKGKRLASLQEPSDDERINIGLMKELSGGDKIMARHIYQEPVEFNPQFKMLLLCNHLPEIGSDDGGTWRRIRVVNFTSKFVPDPNPERNSFPIDLDLGEKMDKWKTHFMAMLLHYFKKYKEEGIQEPEDVLQCTTEYKNQNDHIANFLQEYISKAEDNQSFISLSDIFSEFKSLTYI